MVITDEIAAAAALVAEAEMAESWNGSEPLNVTRRVTAASTGTYWMQGECYSPKHFIRFHQRRPCSPRDTAVLFAKALCLGAMTPAI